MTERLGLTPSQTAGPYLSIGLLRDLVPAALLDPADPRTIRIRGRLLDGAGEGVRDGLVEIWQADGDRPLRRRRRSVGIRPLRHGGRRAVRVRHAEARARRVARRRSPGAARRRRHPRPRAAETGRDAALLPRRGGCERSRPRPLGAFPDAARDAGRRAGGRRTPVRHSLAGAGADDILRGVTRVRRPVRPRRDPRCRLGAGVAGGDARRGAARSPRRAPRWGLSPPRPPRRSTRCAPSRTHSAGTS